MDSFQPDQGQNVDNAQPQQQPEEHGEPAPSPSPGQVAADLQAPKTSRSSD